MGIYTNIDQFVFNVLIVGLFSIIIWGMLSMESLKTQLNFNVSINQLAHILGILIATGPIITGVFVLILFGDNKHFLFPFHKEKLFGQLGINLILNILMDILPIYILFQGMFATKGQTV